MILSQMSRDLDSLNIESYVDIYVAESENGIFNKIVLVTEEDRKYVVLIGSKPYNYALTNTIPHTTIPC